MRSPISLTLPSMATFILLLLCLLTVSAIPVEIEDDTAAVMAPDHGPPYCNPTGPGVCNLAFYARNGPGKRHQEVFVYNCYCRLICESKDKDRYDRIDLFSELPYVVVYNFNSWKFWYAGKAYSRKHGDCITYRDHNGSPLPAAYITQCAFDCYQGGWNDGRADKSTGVDGRTEDSSSAVQVRTTDTAVVAAQDHGPPYCTPTGPGVCNLAFYSRDGPGKAHHEVYIFNRYCREIGSSRNKPVSGWQDLFSELPFVVVYWHNHWIFKYAGKTYGDTFGNCVRYRDFNGAPLPPASVTQCAFDCYQGGWHDRVGNSTTIGDRDPESSPAIEEATEDSTDHGLEKRSKDTSEYTTEDAEPEVTTLTAEPEDTDHQNHLGHFPRQLNHGKDHGPPYCDPTGSGTCTLAFYHRDHRPGDHREIFIYNRYCKQIGEMFNIAPGTHWFDIFGQLPYSVVANFGRRRFKYAGQEKIWNSDCMIYQDNNAVPPFAPAEIIQCDFHCGTGHWEHWKRSIDHPAEVPLIDTVDHS